MRTSEACGCGGSFSGARRDWLVWRKGHDCVMVPAEPQRMGAGDSWSQIQTQDGRWLFDREIPEVL